MLHFALLVLLLSTMFANPVLINVLAAPLKLPQLPILVNMMIFKESKY